jgi:DNA-binding CsgD family transcriptional regulator
MVGAGEFEIMRRRLRGRSAIDIGKSMQLNSEAVMNYCAAIKRKLNAGSALPLLRLAHRLGLNLQRLK